MMNVPKEAMASLYWEKWKKAIDTEHTYKSALSAVSALLVAG